MKVVILAGGYGTRLNEETIVKPKPMVEIGGKPILWHIMNIFWANGFKEFIIALGYKGEVIKEYFLHYYNCQNDFTVFLETGDVAVSKKNHKNWIVHLVDTGIDTMTGGRIQRLKNLLSEEPFMLTYGDGVADVNIKKLVEFHKSHGRIATVTTVRPAARFGGMKFRGNKVLEFKEKPQTEEGWVNGGFFVFQPDIFRYLGDDDTILEAAPLENLARDGELMAYKHESFWQCMDTIRDKHLLENYWQSGNAKWKIWSDD